MSDPKPLYLDACATAPPSEQVLAAMAEAHAEAWGNPSSLHGYGLAAAEQLERSRQRIAELLGCDSEEVVFTSGGSESIHLALLGAAARLSPGRLVISAVEHPATLAAAARLEERGWSVATLPVDTEALVDETVLERLLAPPTRLVSLIWGQSEVGSLQPLERIAARCRAAGVILHVDAVQVVGHRPLQFHQLPIDLLSFTAHKLQGPRGIGALLVRRGIGIVPLVGGGAQERGRRGGTEPVALAAGMARALELCADRLEANGGEDPLEDLRDQLLERLLSLPGLRLSGPDPRVGGNRLPHHISLLVSDRLGRPMAGRDLVRALWQEGVAASSGSACSSSRAASPVLLAMGCTEQRASSGIRLSLGPWLSAEELERVAPALDRAREQVQA